MAVPVHAKKPSVYIDGKDVVIVDLRLGDADLVELVREGDAPEQTVQSCLTVGARVVRMTQTTVDAAVVERRFAALEHRVEEGVEKAVERVGETAKQYLDPEEGALKAMLDEVEKALGDAFDPTSKASILAKFDDLLTGGTADIKKAVREMVDPGNPDSPLGRLRNEMSNELKDLRQAVEQLKTQVAVDQAGAEVFELTAIKGRKFEEAAFEAAASFTSFYGDEAELVGDTNGSEGSRCGDIVITLNEADTPGARARYVVEVKDRKLPLKEAMRELEKAMKNRDAKAGVIVFSGQTKAPIAAPLQLFGAKAVVVLDKDEPDPRAFQLALANARCAAQRQLNGVGEVSDLEAVLALVEQGQQALACQTTIKRYHATAQKQIVLASREVRALIDQVDEVLSQIAAKLRK